MRILKALIISLLVYALFIFLFFRYFSEIKVPPKELDNHVIKIDIRNIPLPPKPVVAQPKIEPIVQKVVKKTSVIKKPVRKKIIKKKVVKKKKKIVKKKPIKKKTIKKKKHIVKKKPAKKKLVKKKVHVPKKMPSPIMEELMVEEEIVEAKTTALESFESEMVYMDESMLLPQQKQHTSKPIVPSYSYPNSKIKKLYGSGFHSFTATQKKFIEENLDTIQTITQRILSQRGYPEDAGRTRQAGTNVVSFNLHPNGDISDLHLKTRIGYRALDENTLSLIRVAYMDYPYPSTTTRIVFYVTYSIY